jgi:hypothetical protein
MQAAASRPLDLSAVVERYRAVTESVRANTAESLVALYSETAVFEDPVSRVRGRAGVRRVLADAWRHVPRARFAIRSHALAGDRLHTRWSMVVDTPTGEDSLIEGMAELVFDADGLIDHHVDYFDAARAIYRRVPILGGVIELVRRRVSSGWAE